MIQQNHTSTLYMKAERPKIREENCRRSIRLTTDDRMPPRNKYSLRLATKAAPEKQANTATDPRKAITTILQHQTSSPVLEKPTCQALLLLFLHTNHARNHVPYNRWSMSVTKQNLFYYHMPSLYHSHV